ncbi:hypothetical protein L1887_25061 [Cichorium endivia]|nr:hypothetical protein L1887_25061 [Cichorium endivia]
MPRQEANPNKLSNDDKDKGDEVRTKEAHPSVGAKRKKQNAKIEANDKAKGEVRDKAKESNERRHRLAEEGLDENTLGNALKNILAKASYANCKCTSSIKELVKNIIRFIDSLTMTINDHKKYVKKSFATVMATLGTRHGEEFDKIHIDLKYYTFIVMFLSKFNSKLTRDTTMIIELPVSSIKYLRKLIIKLGDFLESPFIDLGKDALSKTIQYSFLKVYSRLDSL